METSLDRLKPGRQGVVIQINARKELKERLRCFGLIPGTVIRCCYRNPWGDVTALNFRGSMIAVRTEDLRRIRVRCI